MMEEKEKEGAFRDMSKGLFFFTSLSKPAVVVISVMLCASSAIFAHSGIMWLTLCNTSDRFIMSASVNNMRPFAENKDHAYIMLFSLFTQHTLLVSMSCSQNKLLPFGTCHPTPLHRMILNVQLLS